MADFQQFLVTGSMGFQCMFVQAQQC